MKFATIFKEDLEYISRCILDYPNIETGGDFFGFWNNLGFPVIQYVTGQGINSNQQVTFFQQDINYLLKVSNAAYQSFAMQHIGSWHSHHKLGLAKPSGHDAQTMANAINKNGLNQFFMILGNIKDERTTINGFLFDRENQCNYSETCWNILYEKNTLKENIDKLVGKELYLPRTARAKFTDLKLINNTKTETVILITETTPVIEEEQVEETQDTDNTANISVSNTDTEITKEHPKSESKGKVKKKCKLIQRIKLCFYKKYITKK